MIVEGRFSATTHTTHTLRGRSIRFDLVGLWLARGRRRPQRDQTSGTISASVGARIRPPGAPVDRHHPEPVPEPFSGAKSDRFYATIRATSTRVSTTAPQKLAILKIFPSIDSLSCSLALRCCFFERFRTNRHRNPATEGFSALRARWWARVGKQAKHLVGGWWSE